MENEELPVFTDIFELSERSYLALENRIRSDGTFTK